MAFHKKKPKKPLISMPSYICTTLFILLVLTVPAFLVLHRPTASVCAPISAQVDAVWSGDLRVAQFAWNRLLFSNSTPPHARLRIAAFSRNWPVGSVPGGMERHAFTLHNALARRGHDVHVYTSPVDEKKKTDSAWDRSQADASSPTIHFHEGNPGKWNPRKAWEMFQEANVFKPFDVVHSESVALPYWLAQKVPNLAVSWQGIAMEIMQSFIYQDLIRPPEENIHPDFNRSLHEVIPKVLNEIRFFKKYQHHVATGDSCGEMLRDVYQIPNKRVHVILNGVNEEDFREDPKLGREFRLNVGVPKNASVVFGIAGRLVRDKGHPILYEAFSIIKDKFPNVYLIVVGTGPWQQRYKELGPQVIALGSMNPSQLRVFYNAIDIFVSPTLRPQGVDQTLMEAMMIGKPIMASRFPSIKGSIVIDDEFGFLFTPNVESLIETLEVVAIEGPMRLRQRGKACQAYATSMFAATRMALAYERLFLCINNETFCTYP